jgi:hypothetical protein
MLKESIIIILLIFPFSATAQNTVQIKTNNGNDVNSVIEKRQIDSLYKFYSSSVDPSCEIINGRAYNPPYYRSEFEPLLFINKKHSSTITIKDIKYADVPLNYDTYADQLIYVDSTVFYSVNRALEVILNKDNIESFEMCYGRDTLSFVNFKKGTYSDFNLPYGYYEIAYNASSSLLIKHRSTVYDLDKIWKYKYDPIRYVNIGDGYFKINTEKQFIKLFGDRSDDIRKFIKKSGIKIRKADKRQLVSVLRYYDNIKAGMEK